MQNKEHSVHHFMRGDRTCKLSTFNAILVQACLAEQHGAGAAQRGGQVRADLLRAVEHQRDDRVVSPAAGDGELLVGRGCRSEQVRKA